MKALRPIGMASGSITPEPCQAVIKKADAPLPVDLKAWQRDVMVARMAVLNEIERMEKDLRLSRNKAIQEFLAAAHDGALPAHLSPMVEAANHRNGTTRVLSKGTIYRWFDKLGEMGKMGLAPADTKSEENIPAWSKEFLERYRKPTKPSIPEVLQEMGERAPHYMQAVRFLQKFSRLDAQRGRRTGSELRTVKGYIIRDKSDLLPLDVVVADGHSFKAKVAHPVHGKPFNPEVEGVIDVATRVCIGWSAGLAESAMIVADAMRHAVTVNESKLYGGAFAIFYSDNGAGNTAHVISNEVTGVIARIGATAKTGIPGNPQGRGIVEKMQDTLWIAAAKKLPTYSGKDMDSLAQRRTMKIVEKDIKAQGTSELLIAWGQFLQFCERAVETYNHRPHAALPKITDPVTGYRRHMTPIEMWNRFVAEGWQPVLLEPSEIDDLFKPQVRVKTLRCMVTVLGNTYYNSVLEHHHGEFVLVNYDIHDPLKVWVRNEQQQLICVAEWEKNKKAFFPISAVEQAREQRQERRLRLKEDQIREIIEEGKGVIDHPESIPEEAVISHYVGVDAEATDAEPVEEDTTLPKRPDDFFCNSERYDWHCRFGTHTPDDEAWITKYRESEEYRMLYTFFEDQQKKEVSEQ